jgi:hypothetical protein
MIGWLEFENCAFPCIHLSSPPTAETPNSSTAHASIPISLNNPSNPYFTKDSGVNKKKPDQTSFIDFTENRLVENRYKI